MPRPSCGPARTRSKRCAPGLTGSRKNSAASSGFWPPGRGYAVCMVALDRIAEPWGTRTPYGPGEQWPERVDEFLAEGVDADSVDRWAQSAAVLHSNGDGLDIAVKDGRIVGVRGRGADRVNRGRLDPKDLFGWQANASPDRLTSPLVRVDGELRVPTGTPRWTGWSPAPSS